MAIFKGKLDCLCSVLITAQKMKFSVKDFFSKCDQIRSFNGKLHFLCSECCYLCAASYTAYDSDKYLSWRFFPANSF